MRHYESIRVEIKDKIAHVFLNRPQKANALHEVLWEEIGQIFEEIDEEPALRAVILAGAGKHFCAGIDVSLLAGLSQDLGSDPGRKSEALSRRISHFQKSFNQIERCRKPVLAMVQGACLGAGLDLIAACDLRFCSADAEFAIREIDMGMVADVGSLQRLPKIIPSGLVAELAYTGRSVMGPEAERVGLVNRCFFDADTLSQEVEQVALSIAAKSPLAIRHTKQMLLYARDHSVAQSLDYIAQVNGALLLSDDLTQAVRAFLEKQPARYED